MSSAIIDIVTVQIKDRNINMIIWLQTLLCDAAVFGDSNT